MADEYTPTTEDVLSCYAAIGSGPDWDTRTAEACRWLASELAAAERRGAERGWAIAHAGDCGDVECTHLNPYRIEQEADRG